jgi:DNA-binding GntR family transcriptional regulator
VLADSQTLGLTAVERRSTTHHVLAELRATIVAGRIGPSQPLRETALAQTLGTGRSAIREAIRQLVQKGPVEYRLTSIAGATAPPLPAAWGLAVSPAR